MRVLFWGTVIFCLAFLLQLVIWRIRIPKRQTKVLLGIFFGTLFVGLLALKASPYLIPGLGIYALKHPLEYLHISLSFISLTLAYMITYSAVEVDSPSLVMIMTIAKAGPEGLDEKRFESTMNDDLLVVPRINDLIMDKMAYLEDGKYKLTTKGVLISRIFIIYRKILGTGKGG